MNIEEIKLL